MKLRVKLTYFLLSLCMTGVSMSIIFFSSQQSKYDEHSVVIVEQPIKPELWDIFPSLNKESFSHAKLENVLFSSEQSQISIQHEQAWTSFLGFAGTYYTNVLNEESVIVIERSITYASDGNWQALGLVRNEMKTNANAAIVEAQLYNQQAEAIGTILTDVLVNNLRPGEPAPFVIKSDIPAEQVARVQWNVTVKDNEIPVSRDQAIQVNYEIPFVEKIYKGKHRTAPNYPYELSVDAMNLGEDVFAATLTGAWLNDHGQVVYVQQATLHNDFMNGIMTGGSAGFEIISIDEASFQDAASLIEYPRILWVEGAIQL